MKSIAEVTTGYDKKIKWNWWLGDMAALEEWLTSKPWISQWGILKVISASFRALGSVAFANSPIAGLLVYVGLFVQGAEIGAAGTLGCLVAIILNKLLGEDDKFISNGVKLLNCAIVGTVSAYFYPLLWHRPLDWIYWISLLCTLVICVFVDNGLNNILKPAGIPAFTLPFNISTCLLFLCLDSIFKEHGSSLSVVTPVNSTKELFESNNTLGEDIQWHKVFEGSLLAAGQIYALPNIASSAMIMVGFFIYSPILTAISYVGGILAALLALLFTGPPYTSVYEGVWSFNAFMCGGALPYFCLLSPNCLLMAIVNAALSAAFQAAITPFFAASNLPVMTYPFNLASYLVMAASSSSLAKPKQLSSPELHSLSYFKSSEQENVA